MIRVTGDAAAVEGPMTLAAAAGLLEEGSALVADGAGLFDLAGVTAVDSSGLSVVFGWLRAARAHGKSLRIANPPKDFVSLAEVYGVADQLPLA